MGVVVLFVLAWTLGTPFVQRMPPRSAERTIFRLYAGLSLSAVAALAIGSFSLIALRVVFGLAAAVAVVWGIRRRYGRPDDGGEPEVVRGPRIDRFGALCLGAIVTANTLTFLSALAPVTSWDAGTAHLAAPAAYTRLGRIALLEGNVYSAYPQLLHTLFTYVFAESGERATAIASWALTVLACAAVYVLGKRVGGVRSGFVASALFATAPIYQAQSGTVAIDVPFTGWIAAALAALVVWRERNEDRYLFLAAIISGSACGIRHTGYLVALFIALWLAATAYKVGWRAVVTFAGVAVVASAPWWLRSWALVGNPVYPLLTSVFGNGGVPDVQVTAPLQHESARAFGLVNFVTFPWRIVMDPAAFDGWQASPGGLILALGVVGVAIGGARVRWLGAFSGAGIVTLYFVQRLARYLLPFFIPLYVAGGVAAVELRALTRPIRWLLVFSFVYGLAIGAAMMHFKLPASLGLESRDAYLTRRLERYPAFAWANKHLPAEGAILTLDPRSYYLNRATFQNLAALEPLRGRSAEEQALWMRRHGIRYIFVPDAYVNASPIFDARGITPLIAEWRAHPALFAPIYDENVPRPRGEGAERVEILEVIRGNDDAGR